MLITRLIFGVGSEMLQELEAIVHHNIENSETAIVFSYRYDEESNVQGFYMTLEPNRLGYVTHLPKEFAVEMKDYLQRYIDQMDSEDAAG